MKELIKKAIREVLEEVLVESLKSVVTWYNANKLTLSHDVQIFGDEFVNVATKFLTQPKDGA